MVVEGRRTQFLTHMARTLRRQGLEPPLVGELLRAVNADHCRPPLSGEVLSAITDSSSR
jgi:hypothetical protein